MKSLASSKVGITALAVVLIGHLAGCASSAPKMEALSVAKRLGFPRCKVSVPMSQDEVLQSAKRWGDPYAETRSEWAAIVAAAQPGDQLRLVDCIRPDKEGIAGGYYFYGLFRGQAIVAQMPGAIIN